MPAKTRSGRVRRKPWWQTSFTAEIAEYLFHFPPELTRAEAAEVLRRSRTAPGSRVLDLACGTGRHAFEFARRGMRVVGFDASADFLRIARRRAAASRHPERLAFVRGDMREVAESFPAGSFDLVALLWNSFGYFDRRSDDLKCLRQIASVLAPGGALVLNTMNARHQRRRNHDAPASFGEESAKSWSELEPGCYALLKQRFDPARRRVTSTWIVADCRPGRAKHLVTDYESSVYSLAELKKMLRRAGLELESLWGEASGGRFDRERSKLLTFVARKPPARTRR